MGRESPTTTLDQKLLGALRKKGTEAKAEALWWRESQLMLLHAFKIIGPFLYARTLNQN